MTGVQTCALPIFYNSVLSEDVREFVAARNEERGWRTDTDTIIETIMDGSEVYREKLEDARWWYEENVVAQLGDQYIMYPWAISTRDMSAQESGWEMCLDEIRFVHAVEKTIIVYE